MTTKSRQTAVDRRSVSGQLREAIEDDGRTCYALGQEAEVDPGMIQRFLNGERGLSLATVDRLALALGLRLVETARTRGRPSSKPRRPSPAENLIKPEIETPPPGGDRCTVINLAKPDILPAFADVGLLSNAVISDDVAEPPDAPTVGHLADGRMMANDDISDLVKLGIRATPDAFPESEPADAQAPEKPGLEPARDVPADADPTLSNAMVPEFPGDPPALLTNVNLPADPADQPDVGQPAEPTGAPANAFMALFSRGRGN